MADVTLAEFSGNVWLVGGEQYTDALLFNSLPASVSVELITCDSRTQVRQMWVQLCGEPLSPSEPVLIHPRIADRVRRSAAGRAVYFAQWSAMLDDDALSVLRGAAEWMTTKPALQALLIAFVSTDSAPGVADLSRLRLTLIGEKLVEFGIDRARLHQESRVSELASDAQRIQIEIADPV